MAIINARLQQFNNKFVLSGKFGKVNFPIGQISWDLFKEYTLARISDGVARPGGFIDYDVILVLDKEDLPKSWFKNSDFVHYFFPDFQKVKIVCNRRKSTKLEYSKIQGNVIPSEEGFFSKKEASVVETENLGPARVKGKMIWDHKTAPVLEIEGQGTLLTPDEIAALRRR